MAHRVEIALTAVIALGVTALAYGQGAPPAAENPAAAEDPAPENAAATQESVDDEVIVTGERSLFRLRAELQTARENVWEAFNAINSDDDFDITCKETVRTGTRMKSRSCRPKYANDGTRRAGTNLTARLKDCTGRDGFDACLAGAMASGSAEAHDQIARTNQMDARLNDEFQELARQNPELATAILDYLEKDREYNDAVRSRKE